MRVIAAWDPVTWVGGRRRVNPLLDLPLKPYAGIGKATVRERVGWLAERERDGILYDEQSWEPPKCTTVDPATMHPLADAEADARHARMMAWWTQNQEAPLLPRNPAAAVSVWLWRNGLCDQRSTCSRQSGRRSAPSKRYRMDRRERPGGLPPCRLP